MVSGLPGIKNVPKPLETCRRLKEIQGMTQKVSATISTTFPLLSFNLLKDVAASRPLWPQVLEGL